VQIIHNAELSIHIVSAKRFALEGFAKKRCSTHNAAIECLPPTTFLAHYHSSLAKRLDFQIKDHFARQYREEREDQIGSNNL